MPRPQADVVRDAWKAGVRYFWDPALRTHFMEEDPATRPTGEHGFWDAWNVVRQRTLLDPWRAENLARLLWEVRDVPGDIVECGTWQGGMSVMMALLCRAWGVKKRVYMLDSFQGLPPPVPGVDKFHQAGWCQANHRDVVRFVIGAGVIESVEVRAGWFKDTLPALGEATFCLAHLDGDLYESTRDCLEGLRDRVVTGGTIAVDDYHDSGEGVTRAVDEYLRETGDQLHLGPIPQVYIRVGQRAPRRRHGQVVASTRDLQANAPYVRMVREVGTLTRRDAEALERMSTLLARRVRAPAPLARRRGRR
jgi:hypothetical protein